MSSFQDRLNMPDEDNTPTGVVPLDDKLNQKLLDLQNKNNMSIDSGTVPEISMDDSIVSASQIDNNKPPSNLLGKLRDTFAESESFTGVADYLNNTFPNIDNLENINDPTVLQSFASGLLQDVSVNEIKDYGDRIAGMKTDGTYDENSDLLQKINSGVFGIGELMQFMGIMKVARAGAGPTAQFLAAKRIIDASSRFINPSITKNVAKFIPGSTARKHFVGVARNQGEAVRIGTAFLLETGLWKSLNHSTTEAALYAGGFPLAFNSYIIPGIKTAWKGASGFVKGKSNRKGETSIVPQTTDDGQLIPLNNIKEILNLSKKEIEEARKVLPKNDGRHVLFDEIEKLQTSDKATIQEVTGLIKGLEIDTKQLINTHNKELVGLFNGLSGQEIKVISGQTVAGSGKQTEKIMLKIQNAHKKRSAEFFESSLNEFDNILNKFVDDSLLGLNSKTMKFDATTIQTIEKNIIGDLEQLLLTDANPVLRNMFALGNSAKKGVKPYAIFNGFKSQIQRKIRHKIQTRGVATQENWFRNIGINAKNTDADNIDIIKSTVNNLLKSGTQIFNTKTTSQLETLGTVIKQIKPKITKEPRGFNYNRKLDKYEQTSTVNIVTVPKKTLDKILNMNDKELYALGRDFNLSLTQISRAIKDLQKHVKESTLDGKSLGRMDFFNLKREKGMYYFSGKHGGMQIASLLNTINKFTRSKMYKNIAKEGTTSYIARRVYNKGAALGRQSKLNQTQKTITRAEGRTPVQEKSATIASREAKGFIQNLTDRATLAYYGLDPSDLRNFTKRLKKRQAGIDAIEEKFSKGFYEASMGGPKQKIMRLEQIFSQLKDKSRVLGGHFDVFNKLSDLKTAVKMVSEYNSTNATLNGSKGFNVFTKDLEAILKKVDGAKRSTEKVDIAMQRDYNNFVANFNKSADNSHVMVQDIQDVMIGLVESTGLKKDIMTRALPSVFRALNDFVKTDMATLYGKLSRRVEQGSQKFSEQYQPLVKNIQEFLAKGKVDEAEKFLASAIIKDRKLQQFLVKDNSPFGELLLLQRAMGDPGLRSVLKETILRNKNHTHMLDIMKKLNQFVNPKFFGDVPTTGANIQNMSTMLGDSQLKGQGGVFGRFSNYFFTEIHNIARSSGDDSLSSVNNLISDSIQKLQRLTSKGGPIDLDVINYNKGLDAALKQINKGRNAAQQMTVKDVDDIIVALDKLETEAGGKLAKSVDYLKAKDSIMGKLPVEIRQVIDDFYDLTWKHAEAYNDEIRRLQALFKTNNVFPDTGTAVPWRKGLGDELQIIERRENYFPRFTDRQNQETYEIYSQTIGAGGKKGPVVRVHDTVKSLKKVHEVIRKHVDNKALGKDENIVYSFKVNQPMANVGGADGIPRSRLNLVLDDMDQMTSMDHRAIQKLLDDGTFNYETFYHKAFVSGPSMVKKRYNVDGAYETNHIKALEIYLNRIVRHTSMLEAVVKSDSLLAYYSKTPPLFQGGINGIGSMKEYIPYLSRMIDEALGRPSTTTKQVNDAMNELISTGLKKVGINTNTNFDIRTLVNVNNKYNYFSQFASNIAAAFIQTNMAATSVVPSLGKHAIKGILNKDAIRLTRDVGRFNAMKQKASTLPNIKSIASKHEKYFEKMRKEEPEKYQMIEDIQELYTHNNLNLDSSGALLLADTFVSQVGGTGAKGFVTRNWDRLGEVVNYATKPFKKGDELPRKMAIRAAYLSADDVFTDVVKKLNILGLDWKTKTYNVNKVLSMIRNAKGMSALTPLEEKAMSLIVNSEARTFMKKGRYEFAKKVSKGDKYTYQTNRDFKKDLATRFQEDTNHLYNVSHNTAFMNNQVLKSYNLYKKFAVKEFGRITGLFQKQDYKTAMGSLLGYGVLGGAIGVPFGKDLLALYSWAYRSTAGIFGTERGLPSTGAIDPEFTLRASGDNWVKNLIGFGVGATAGVDLTSSSSVGLGTYFDPRGKGFLYGKGAVSKGLDFAANVALGDTYIRLSKFLQTMFNRPVTIASEAMVTDHEFGADAAYENIETKENIRLLEGVSHLFPGSKHVFNAIAAIYGQGPMNYEGKPSDVYNALARDEDGTLDKGFIFAKGLGFTSMDQKLFDQNKSGIRKQRLNEVLRVRQEAGIREVILLQGEIEKLKYFQPEGYEDDIDANLTEIKEISENLQLSREQIKNEVVTKGIGAGRLIERGGNILEKQEKKNLIDEGYIDKNTGRFIKQKERIKRRQERK